MQSGKIKKWNKDKGYGFIDVDDQSEDVFFHITSVRLSQPVSEGQRVYFTSERNDKNQLRAVEVTSTSLSLQEAPSSHSTKKSTTLAANANLQDNSKNHKSNQRRIGQKNRSPISRLFSIIAIIALAAYFFGDLQSIFDNSPGSTTIAQSAETTNQNAITGDAQIDNTIALIGQGGPFPYPAKDGTTFYNREGRLPKESSGYYREYTVPTPGVSHRGARRIVTGGNPPAVYYLTVDHYDSFSQLEVN
ncbi:ribonuclease domain-containing protein [Psychrobacter sp. M13]|uniref:ribonuclease domain-containing protein n=1 Tax=Psychrobacter sp. M13 TaxID=3067275 RepID=UPI0019196A13|nr:ribonuclease domain-containing protein [Psychrobacter sp. M13]WLP94896.1 ribonuclease domain-containing protein [Psychrobacter sp. M13]